MGASRTPGSDISIVGGLCAVVLAALGLALAFAASAMALSGKPIKIAEPIHFGQQSVAVDASGTAYIAWSNETGSAGNFVEYCVLPLNATACADKGSLTPADSSSAHEAHIERVQVLVEGTTVIVLAGLYGLEEEFQPMQEWQSTNGGASFSPVDGGKSVANAVVNADTSAIGAVQVPGGLLGYGAITAVGNPTFDAFPLSSPPLCDTANCKEFATLQSPSSPTPLGNLHGVIASQQGKDPGVLAVYETLGKPGPPEGECTPAGDNPFGTAYAYGNGVQSAGNSYNVSPGQPGSAWTELTKGDCEVEYAAVGGGPSGFGVVEENLKTHDTVYHPFDESKHTFDTSQVTIAGEGEEQDSVSQDGAGGIYATFVGDSADTIQLAYSANAGASWSGPVTLNPATSVSQLTSAMGAGGQGWASWRVGESVYAQQFDTADAMPPAASVSGAATSSDGHVTLVVSCPSSEPCTVTIKLEAVETIVLKASVARKKTRKRTITLATGAFTIPGKSTKRLKLHLTGAGRRLLAREHGHLTATVHISTKTAAGIGLTTKAIAIR
ncbi:MAG TPA: hypothetical protein VED41_12000 [Solirubrobacteraceae bacterium]|nr:hypothetical protein [Solirubrobacteraceae bacterium]